jgi:glycyl-tRNA synthetase
VLADDKELMMSKESQERLDKVISLCKRRGFVFQSGDIYGGSRSAWDYGPLGVELKENIKRQWWRANVRTRRDVVGLDSSVILPTKVWEASGHVEVFNDTMVESLTTHKRHRLDHLVEAFEAEHGRKPGHWSEPKAFSGLVKAQLGATSGEEGLHYLRPETAQGIFVNFKHVMETSRGKLPMGIAQVGKSFRNEITPGNFIFRTREFEQMEMEFFVRPEEDEEWFDFWLSRRHQWYLDLGIKAENLRLFEHQPEKLAHYSKKTTDIEYRFGFKGSEFGELEGVANRTDYDLATHMAASGVDMRVIDPVSGKKVLPYVIEPAAGLTRSLMAFLVDAYDEDMAESSDGSMEVRSVLRLDPRLAPVKAAVLPHERKPEQLAMAATLADELSEDFTVDLDTTASIGKRYRRQDEVGTPWCVTLDRSTALDQAVTIRDRDTREQERVALSRVKDYLASRLTGA